jgi:hypothetical protein
VFYRFNKTSPTDDSPYRVRNKTTRPPGIHVGSSAPTRRGGGAAQRGPARARQLAVVCLVQIRGIAYVKKTNEVLVANTGLNATLRLDASTGKEIGRTPPY